MHSNELYLSLQSFLLRIFTIVSHYKAIKFIYLCHCRNHASFNPWDVAVRLQDSREIIMVKKFIASYFFVIWTISDIFYDVTIAISVNRTDMIMEYLDLFDVHKMGTEQGNFSIDKINMVPPLPNIGRILNGYHIIDGNPNPFGFGGYQDFSDAGFRFVLRGRP